MIIVLKSLIRKSAKTLNRIWSDLDIGDIQEKKGDKRYVLLEPSRRIKEALSNAESALVSAFRIEDKIFDYYGDVNNKLESVIETAYAKAQTANPEWAKTHKLTFKIEEVKEND